MATAYETFVNTELPRRSPFLTEEITGYNGDPNDGGAPDVLQSAPLGTWFREETAAKWWRRTETVWEDASTLGGIPGGVDNSVQFKSGTAFTGSTDFKWDDTAKKLEIAGTGAYSWAGRAQLRSEADGRLAILDSVGGTGNASLFFGSGTAPGIRRVGSRLDIMDNFSQYGELRALGLTANASNSYAFNISANYGGLLFGSPTFASFKRDSTSDQFLCGVGTGCGRHFILADSNYVPTNSPPPNFGHSDIGVPAFYVHGANPTLNPNAYIGMYHAVKPTLECGGGELLLKDETGAKQGLIKWLGNSGTFQFLDPGGSASNRVDVGTLKTQKASLQAIYIEGSEVGLRLGGGIQILNNPSQRQGLVALTPSNVGNALVFCVTTHADIANLRDFGHGTVVPDYARIFVHGENPNVDSTAFAGIYNDKSNSFFESGKGNAILKTTAGKLGFTGVEQTTVGSAGAASALPSNPTKYIKITDDSGTELVIPAYAAS